MEVYIEYVIFFNFVIDFWLLKCTYKLLNKKHNTIFVLLASAIGTVFAIVCPIININAVVMFGFKLLFGFIVVYVSAKFISIKDYFISVMIFFSITFLLGGAIYGFSYMLGIDVDNQFSVIDIRSSIFEILLLFDVYLMICIIKYIKTQKKEFGLFKQSLIKISDVQLNVTSCLDTGNSLLDEDGRGVVFISPEILKKIKHLIDYEKDPLSIKTINGKCSIKVFRLSLFEINGNRYKNITASVSLNNFDGFDILVGKYFIKEFENEKINTKNI